MPDFPDPVQDLISRMLTVSVDDRIRIEGIKNHPAFRFNIPKDYTVPTPLPIPVMNEPMDPSTLDPKIIGILKNIGYSSDEEINEEFMAPYHTNAKVFYLMFTKNISYDLLPWPGMEDENGNYPENYVVPDDAFFMSPRQIPAAGATRANDPFHRALQAPDVSSPDIRSFAQRPDWFSMEGVANEMYPNDQGESSTISQDFEDIQLQVEDLMCVIQNYLTQNDIKWFHQSDMEMVAKSFETGMLVTFTAVYQTPEFLKLCLLCKKGPHEAFDRLLNELPTKITEAINANNS